MKTRLLQSLVISLLVIYSALAQAKEPKQGPGSGGGGDQFTADFINTAETEVYQWLVEHGDELATPISAEEFKKNIDPTKVASSDLVLESCWDPTKVLPGAQDRVVAACYNDKNGMFYINQRLYPLDVRNSPAKIMLVMHEIFRKMGVEGDKYELTRQFLPSQPEVCSAGCALIEIMQSKNFKSCIEVYDDLYHTPAQAADICLQQKQINSDFLSPNFKACFAQHDDMNHDPSEAADICIEPKQVATDYTSANFKACVKAVDDMWVEPSDAGLLCGNLEYVAFDFTSKLFDACYGVYSNGLKGTEAVDKCMKLSQARY